MAGWTTSFFVEDQRPAPAAEVFAGTRRPSDLGASGKVLYELIRAVFASFGMTMEHLPCIVREPAGSVISKDALLAHLAGGPRP
jgi:hypothetical protein